MKAESIVQNFRRISDDMDTGYEADLLWSDEELLNYLDISQREAAARSKCITDESTTAVTQISIVAGTSLYSMHSSIIRIDGMYLASTGKEIKPIIRSDLYKLNNVWRSASGVVTHASSDWGQKTLTLYRTPTENDTLDLEVVRLPINDVSQMTTVLEIPDDFVNGLLDGVAYLAYLKNDSQTQDLKLAEYHRALFERRFGVQSSAQNEMVYRKYRGKKARSRSSFL